MCVCVCVCVCVSHANLHQNNYNTSRSSPPISIPPAVITLPIFRFPVVSYNQAPESYKDVSEVVDTCHAAGISKKVVKLRPVAVIKG